MNKIFKVVWSKTKECYVVVSEVAKNNGGKKKVLASVLAGLAMVGVAAQMGTPVQADSRYNKSTIVVAPNGLSPAYSSGTYKGSENNDVSYNSIVVGFLNNAYDPSTNGHFIFGANNKATNESTLALGNNNEATGPSSTAIGSGSEATGRNTIAMGNVAKANQIGNLAIGSYAKAQTSGTFMSTVTHAPEEKGYAVALGGYAEATEHSTVAVGAVSKASGFKATAVGAGAQAKGDNSTVVGTASVANSGDSFVGGFKNVTHGDRNVAVGTNNTVAGEDSIGVGSGVIATTGKTIAIGNTMVNPTYPNGRQTIARGKNKLDGSGNPMYGTTDVDNIFALAIGNGAQADGTAKSASGMIAIGQEVTADNNNTVAIGVQTKATGSNALAIGSTAQAIGASSAAFGTQAVANGLGATAFGPGASAGDGSTVADGSTAVGRKSTVTAEGGTGIGWATTVSAKDATAIGHSATANIVGGVALGSNSVTTTAAGVQGYNPATGRTNKYSDQNAAVGTSTLAAVSVGNGTTATRQITGLAAGTDDTDAVNVAQLKNVNLKYAADTGNSDVLLKDGTLKVKGDNDLISTSVVATGADKGAVQITAKVGGTINNTDGKAVKPTTNGIATTDNVADAINNSYWKATAGGNTDGTPSVGNVKPGTQVTYSAGDNLKVKQTIAANGNQEYKYSLNPVLTGITSIANTTTGPKMTFGGNSINITGGSLDMGNNKITNLATGTDDKDAVNVKQLKDTEIHITPGTYTPDSNKKVTLTYENGDNKTVAGKTAVIDLSGLATGGTASTESVVKKAAATGDTNIADVSVAGGKSVNDPGAQYEVSVSKNAVKDAAREAVTVNNGGNTDNPISVTPTQDNTNHNTTYAVTFDGNKAAKQIPLTYKATNGTTTTADQTVKLDKGLNFTGGDYTTASVGADGKVTFDVNLGTAPTVTDGKPGVPGQAGAAGKDGIATVKTVVDTINNSGWKANAKANGGTLVGSSTATVVKPGDQVNFAAGKNLTVKQDLTGEHTYTYSLNKDLKDLTSVEIGGSTIKTDGDHITITSPDTTTGATPGATVTNKVANLGDEKHIKPDTYAVATDGSVTLKYVDGNGKDLTETTKITGITNQNLSNISTAGETKIKNLAKSAINMEDGKNTKASKRDVNGVDTYKVDVEGDLTGISSITNGGTNNGKISFGPNKTVTVDGDHSITLNASTGKIGGLQNLTFDPTNFTSGQAATEDQLKSVHDTLKASELHIAPTESNRTGEHIAGGATSNTAAGAAANAYKYDATTKQVVLEYNDGTGANKTGTKAVIDFSALNTGAGASSWNIASDKVSTTEGTVAAGSAATQNIADGKTVTMKAGKNLTVKQENVGGNASVAFSLDKDLKDLDSVTTNKTITKEITLKDPNGGTTSTTIKKDGDRITYTNDGSTTVNKVANLADEKHITPGTYSVDSNGKVTMTYTDGNGGLVPNTTTVIDGLVTKKLDNIDNDGKKTITGLGTIVKAGDNVTVSEASDATTGQKTYTVNAVTPAVYTKADGTKVVKRSDGTYTTNLDGSSGNDVAASDVIISFQDAAGDTKNATSIVNNVGSAIKNQTGGDFLTKLDNANTATPNAAVNVSDLKNTADGLTNKGLKFDANSGGVKTNKLGSTVKVQGAGTSADANYSGANIKTFIDQDTTGNTTIDVKLDKNLTGINSISNTTTGPKMEFGGNSINITGGSLNMGGSNITNLKSGIVNNNATDDTNAANIGDVKKIAKDSDLHIAPTAGTTNNVAEYTVDANNKVTLTYQDGNGTAVTAPKAVIDLSALANKITSGYTFNANATANGGTVANDATTPAAVTAVANGGTINYAAGKNLTVKQDIDTTNKTHTYTYSLDKDINVETVTVTGQNGKDGKIGINGKNGTNGVNGTNRVDIQVEKGVDGIDGKNGTDGISRIVYEDKTGTHTVATMDDGLKFTGNNTVIENKQKLGSLVKVQGEGTKEGTTVINPTTGEKELVLSDGTTKFESAKDNIAVVADGADTLTVKLNKKLKGLDSVQTKTVELGDHTTPGGTTNITYNSGDKRIEYTTPGATAGTTETKKVATTDDIWTIQGNGTDVAPVNGKVNVKAGENILITTPTTADGSMTINAVTPAVYTDKDGNKLTKDKDGKFHKDDGTEVAAADVITSIQDAAGHTTGGNSIVNNVGSAINNHATPGVTSPTYLDKLDAAAGDNNTKNAAVNVTDLKNTKDGLIDKGLKFDANVGGVKTNKLGSTVKVQGAGTSADADYSGANIKTFISQTGDDTTIDVKLDKNLKGINKISNGGSSITLNDTPSATVPAVTITGGNLSMGDGTTNNKIVNLAPGTADTDAVNVKQLKDTELHITPGTYTPDTNKKVKLTYTDGNGALVSGKEAVIDLSGLSTGGATASTWNVKSSANTTDGGAVDANHNANAQNIADGKSVEFQSGKNLVVKQTNDTTNGNATVEFSLSDKITVGKDGANGKDGSVGAKGADGSAVVMNGADGSIGLNGTNGANGISIKGKDGANGVGIDGKDGVTRIVYTEKVPDPANPGTTKEVTHEVATMDDGLKFTGNNTSTENKQKLGSLVKVQGEGTKESTVVDPATGKKYVVLSDGTTKFESAKDNIAVEADGTDTLTVKLNKNLKGLNSIQLGGNTIQSNGDNITFTTNGGTTKTVATTDQLWTIQANGTDVPAKSGKVNLVAGDHITITPDATNGKMTISATGFGSMDGFNVKTSAESATVGTHAGDTTENIKNGKTVDMQAGKNLVVTQTNDGNGNTTVNYALNKDVDLGTNGSLKTGDTTINNDGFKNGNTTVGGNGMTIKDPTDPTKTVSLTKDGLNNGGNQITNVASGGNVDTNAANIGDIKRLAKDTRIKDGTYTVDNNGTVELTYVDGAGNQVKDASGNAITAKITGLTTLDSTRVKVAVNETGSGKAVGSKAAVKVTKGTEFVAGDNLIVERKANAGTDVDNSVVYSLNKDLKGIETIKNGNTTITLHNNPTTATDPTAVTITGGNINMGGNRIVNVAPAKDGTDAVNLDQLKAARTKVTSNDGTVSVNRSENTTTGEITYDLHVTPGQSPDLNRVNNRIDQLGEEIGRVGAQGAALSALKPIQYDPLEPTQIMAGYGNYRGNSAVALGVAHYKNESTLIHGGVSWAGGSSHMMANAGVTWKVGNRDSEAAVADRYRKGPISSAYAMQQEMAAMKAQNAGLKGEVSDLKAENEQMKAQIAAMMAKLGL